MREGKSEFPPVEGQQSLREGPFPHKLGRLLLPYAKVKKGPAESQPAEPEPRDQDTPEQGARQ